MVVKLGANEINYITLFENLTGALTKDCIADEEDNKIIFVVKKGDMGLAIGKKGTNVQKVKNALGKRVKVLEYSDDPVEFVKNILHPAKIRDISLKKKRSEKVVVVDVDKMDRPLAIGKNGRNIKQARMLVGRHHKIGDIIIT